MSGARCDGRNGNRGEEEAGGDISGPVVEPVIDKKQQTEAGGDSVSPGETGSGLGEAERCLASRLAPLQDAIFIRQLYDVGALLRSREARRQIQQTRNTNTSKLEGVGCFSTEPAAQMDASTHRIRAHTFPVSLKRPLLENQTYHWEKLTTSTWTGAVKCFELASSERRAVVVSVSSWKSRGKKL